MHCSYFYTNVNTKVRNILPNKFMFSKYIYMDKRNTKDII